MPTPCHRNLVLGSSFLFFQYAEACFDSSGDFYCTTLWYFWFALFWIFMFLFVGIMCIVNRCNKKNRQVDIQINLPPIPRTARGEGEGTNGPPPPPPPRPTTTTTTTGWTETETRAAS
ncbi:uncharacterized protein LOC143275313 [Babylonia areolata]|uniref:uncharacterized protein LOC143275313 n=1 Tax=Babylonia areolata TaxID=304850 RepID=UPI003FCFB573